MYYDPMSYIVSLRARDIEDIFKDYGYNDVYVTCVDLGGISFILQDIDNIKECNISDICDDISDDISNILCNQQESILKEYNITPEKYPWCTPKHIQRMNSMEEGEELEYSRVSTKSDIEEYFEEEKRSFCHTADMIEILEQDKAAAQYPLPLSSVEEGMAIEEQIEHYATTKKMSKKNISELDIGAPFMRYVHKVLSSSESSKDSSITVNCP